MKQIIIDELSVTLRDLEIERLNKKVRRLEARCEKLKHQLEHADELHDENLAQNSEMLLLVKSFHETTGQTKDFRQFCRERLLSRDDQLVWQRRLANA